VTIRGLFFATCLAAAFAGCKQIELPGLVEAGKLPPDVQAGRTSRADFVEATDSIEFRAVDPAYDVIVQTHDPEGSCRDNYKANFPKDVGFISARPRIPVALLNDIGALQLQTTARGVTPRIPKATALIPVCTRDFDAMPKWDEALTKFFTVAPFRAALVKDPPRRAYPGDELIVTALWYVPGGDTGAKFYEVSQVHTTVDSRGALLVPMLAAPAQINVASAPIGQISTIERISAAANTAMSRITVWQDGKNFDEQPVLQNIASCFAQSKTVPVPLSRPPECYQAWVDSQSFFPGDYNDRLRYRFDPVQHTTVILENDERVQSRFEPYQKIGEVARRISLRHLGKPLLRDEDGARSAYITVVPRDDLGGPFSKPFWYKIHFDRTSDYESVTFLPGDVVFVTRTRPLAL
jgi:hypothetical protein